MRNRVKSQQARNARDHCQIGLPTAKICLSHAFPLLLSSLFLPPLDLGCNTTIKEKGLINNAIAYKKQNQYFYLNCFASSSTSLKQQSSNVTTFKLAVHTDRNVQNPKIKHKSKSMQSVSKNRHSQHIYFSIACFAGV